MLPHEVSDLRQRYQTLAQKATVDDNQVAEMATAIGKLEDGLARLDAAIKDTNDAGDKEHAEAIKLAFIGKSDMKAAELATAIGKLETDLARLTLQSIIPN